MKVTKEHYDLIKKQATKLIDKLIVEKKVNSYEDFFSRWEEFYANYTEQRKVFDFYWAIGGNNWKREAFNGNIYGGDYNDAHLNTAVKKLYKELKK